MSLTDQNKTAFITPRGAYCYKVMSFGLKNTRATYQRMITQKIGHMIWKTVEVYIDDMLIKSLRKEDHVADLTRVVGILWDSHLWLNVSKCTFGVSSGKFLGHMVSRRGIEANPDQIAGLIDLAKPQNAKQVQRLTGMVAALGRFISRLADRCRPFFRLLGIGAKLEQYFGVGWKYYLNIYGIREFYLVKKKKKKLHIVKRHNEPYPSKQIL